MCTGKCNSAVCTKHDSAQFKAEKSASWSNVFVNVHRVDPFRAARSQHDAPESESTVHLILKRLRCRIYVFPFANQNLWLLLAIQLSRFQSDVLSKFPNFDMPVKRSKFSKFLMNCFGKFNSINWSVKLRGWIANFETKKASAPVSDNLRKVEKICQSGPSLCHLLAINVDLRSCGKGSKFGLQSLI